MEIAKDDLLTLLGGVANEGYFVVDVSQMKILYLGQAFERLFNLRIADIMQQPKLLWKWVHPEDHAYVKQKLASIPNNGAIEAEFRIVTEERTKYVDIHAYNLREDGQLIGGYVSDTTTQKNNIVYAEKINGRKNAMLAIIAHDLKEPVAIINLVASAIKRNATTAGDSNLVNNIQVIQDLCDRNIALIKDLMREEFLEAPEVGIKKERTDLVKAIGDIVKQYQSSESVLEKKFAFNCAALQLFAVVDMLKIAQCINNLVANAIKFTPAGGHIEVLLTDMGVNVQIAVSDNGIGIPAALQPYLFERRTRAHRPGLRGEEGAGIGLFIIRLLVELHGGRVWVESQEGKGSTFYIELPKA